ncbi:MAG: S49 family peptidase, partial [Myxococcota bacterium]|nr:S49 family peptidase [Myxococcota bacterium]
MASKTSRLLLWIAAMGMLIFVAVSLAIVLLLSEAPIALSSQPQWMHLKVGASLADAPGNEGMVMDPDDMPPLTTEITRAITESSTDDDIVGIFLEISDLPVGWAQTQELRAALIRFRASGKSCVAWSQAYSNKEFFLASVCDEILLAPTGIFLVNGLSLTTTYFADTLAKLGVEENFEHVGDFKSAVEPYERTGPSDEASQATNALLDSLYDHFIESISEGRNLEADDVRDMIDAPDLTPRGAVDRGLVTALSYRDEALEAFAGDEHVDLADYLRTMRSNWGQSMATVAVIHADGAIVHGHTSEGLFGDSIIGDRTLSEQLEDVREDASIAAVVLRVNSPGGSGSASDAIWHDLRRTAEEKPVVASMSDYAASGGYYIAMAADHVIAQPGTITGSIGVFGGKLNVQGLYEKLGLSTHTYRRGRLADLLSPTSSFGEDGRSVFTGFLEDFYGIFLDRTTESRDLTRD